jgi:hypothetical protein
MRTLFALLLVASTMFCTFARAEDSDAVAKAKEAADLWLVSADAGLYEKTWDQAAGLFQKAVTKAQWTEALKAVRAPVGSIRKRSVISATFAEDPAGAPKGKYVVIRYASDFTKNSEVVETVTPMLDVDGTWKVSGYFVK